MAPGLDMTPLNDNGNLGKILQNRINPPNVFKEYESEIHWGRRALAA